MPNVSLYLNAPLDFVAARAQDRQKSEVRTYLKGHEDIHEQFFRSSKHALRMSTERFCGSMQT